MTQDPDAIHETVRKHYAERIRSSTSCCSSDACCSTDANFYPAELLASLPEGEAAVSYGCGDPITLAALTPGQIVLDLGSGAGLDCFFAAQKVGETGRVIGVDMTPEMIERAQASAERMKLQNVDFRLGYLEELPVDEGTIDVVISNCVINLAPNKGKVFAEVARVLKPGGRLAVSDIVTDGPLPEQIKSSLSAWAGCIAGAIDIDAYRGAMQDAGLVDLAVSPTYFDEAIIEEAVGDMGQDLDLGSWNKEAISRTVFSARITARKP